MLSALRGDTWQVEVDPQLGEADLVATRLVWTAGHVGEAMGLSPTGRPSTQRRSDRSVEDRKVAQTRFQEFDMAG